MNKRLLKEISERFGAKSINDGITYVGSEIIYKEKKYKVQQTGIKIPKNEEEFDLFKASLEPFISQINSVNVEISNHPENEGSPYEGCNGSLFELFDNTRDSLLYFIDDLKEKARPTRLDLDDFMAFYRPFHFYPNTWGIYLDIEKLANQASRIYDFNRQLSPLERISRLSMMDCCLLSFFKTYFHEMYHHKIEMMATKFEIILRKKVYYDGFHKFYCNTFDTDFCLEEAFANVYGLNKSLSFLTEKEMVNYDILSLKRLLRESILRTAPKGYRVSYGITQLEPDIQKDFENKFIEILFDYSYQSILGESPTGINTAIWKLFTYKLDPLINFDNEVTFIIPV